MKRLPPLILALLLFLSCSTKSYQVDMSKSRVLVLGDSISYGLGLSNRVKSNYIGRLRKELGNEYQFFNNSVSGSTLLLKGNLPLWNTKALELAKRTVPDIVIIQLGTNDTKDINWRYKDDFLSDYKNIIRYLKSINKNVEIYVCIPPPSFKNIWGIRGDIIKNELRDLIMSLESITNVVVIDLYTIFNNDPSFFIDNVHPNQKGVELIFNKIYDTIFNKYIDQ